jgi:hypothetical protein
MGSRTSVVRFTLGYDGPRETISSESDKNDLEMFIQRSVGDWGILGDLLFLF